MCRLRKGVKVIFDIFPLSPSTNTYFVFSCYFFFVFDNFFTIVNYQDHSRRGKYQTDQPKKLGSDKDNIQYANMESTYLVTQYNRNLLVVVHTVSDSQA